MRRLGIAAEVEDEVFVDVFRVLPERDEHIVERVVERGRGRERERVVVDVASAEGTAAGERIGRRELLA